MKTITMRAHFASCLGGAYILAVSVFTLELKSGLGAVAG